MKNCNLCKKIDITEKMQDEIKKQTGKIKDHKCSKFNKKVVHRNVAGFYIFPCDECKGKYFEAREMKAICIYNLWSESPWDIETFKPIQGLTKNKEYNVTDNGTGFFVFTDDFGNKACQHKSRFNIIQKQVLKVMYT